MLRIEMEVDYENKSEINEFSLGHMTLIGTYGTCTSKGKTPEQSMMIFISITLLLDGIRQFLLAEKILNYNFVGADCSFQFFLSKTPKGNVMLRCDKFMIDQVSSTELIMAVWRGVDVLVSNYGQYLETGSAVSRDIQSALKRYEATLLG
jgi:hypothetical protein